MNTNINAAKAPRLYQPDYDVVNGRFLTAATDIPPGSTILWEESFSSVPLYQNSVFCSYCYKSANRMIPCSGCVTCHYCSVSCRKAAWKRHHWFECFLGSFLKKTKVETNLALKTVLDAMFLISAETGHISSEDSSNLTQIAKDLVTSDRKIQTALNKTVAPNYLGIYSLQTHATEKETEKNFHSLQKEITHLAKLMGKCVSLYDELLKLEQPSAKEKIFKNESVAALLKSSFQKLTLNSFMKLENFDIRLWRVFLRKYSREIQRSDKPHTKKSSCECMHEPASSVEDILETLLMRHALQMRTNGQAIFAIHSITGGSPVSRMEQERRAIGYFPVMSMMNHSCAPNTTISFCGRAIQVVASKQIRKGEEISHCYGPHYCKHSLLERQRILKEQYFFTCKCQKCAEELEDSDKALFQLQFHAFKCNACGDPIKPDNMNREDVRGKCVNEKCGKKQSCAKAVKLLDKAKSDCKDAQMLLEQNETKRALAGFQSSLKSMQTILFRNHIDVGFVNDQIAQCYVILKDYTAAIQHLNKSIAISGMLYGTDSIEIAHEYQKLASLYLNIGSSRLAERYAEKVLMSYKMHYGDRKTFPPGADEMEQIIKLCQECLK